MSVQQIRGHPLSRLIACALVAGGLGCANSSPSDRAADRASERPTAVERLADAPAWVVRGCRAFWRDPHRRREVVCGVGSAPPHRDRVAARETAIARARSELARSLQVTIESAVRLEDSALGEGDLDAIVHQLSSSSLRGVQIEDVWRAASGETHALVSLDVDRVRESVRSNRALSPDERAELAARAVAAFEALDAADAPGASTDSAPERSDEADATASEVQGERDRAAGGE